MPDIIEKYRSSYSDYSRLIEIAMELSATTHGQSPVTRELEVSSRVFAKICLHGKAIMDLVPKGPLGEPAAAEYEIWDLSSLAVLMRALVDSYYTLYYIGVDQVDAEVKEFRWLLWDHHSETRRLKKLELIGAESQDVSQLREIVEQLTENIKNNPVYLRQPQSIKKKLRNGEYAIFESKENLSEHARISHSYYTAVFMFLSSYVHAHPFSINQLSEFRAGESESLSVINSIINHGLSFMALALRDFMSLMPHQELNLAASDEQLIAMWCDIAANIFQSEH